MRLAIGIPDHQIGTDFCHLLSHQTKLWSALGIDLLFVAECDWLQRKNDFAGLFHWLDLILETSRGRRHSKLTAGIDDHARARNHDPANSGNKGSCLCSVCADTYRAGFIKNTFVADINIIIARGEEVTGGKPQCNVVESGGVVTERFSTDGRVDAAGCVFEEREPTDGRVVGAVVIIDKRVGSNSHVL